MGEGGSSSTAPAAAVIIWQRRETGCCTARAYVCIREDRCRRRTRLCVCSRKTYDPLDVALAALLQAPFSRPLLSLLLTS